MDLTRKGTGFAIVIGVFIIVEGIWELFSPVVFGIFTSNGLHGVIHIALGIYGIVTGIRGGAVRFLAVFGIILVAVGLLWCIPATRVFPEETINVNLAVAVFNLILGAASLLAAASTRQHVSHRAEARP